MWVCKRVDDPPVESTPVSPVFPQGTGHVILLQSTGSGTLNGDPQHNLDTRSLNFLNWLSGHNGPESNSIADVELLWACTQLVIDVGVLGCSWEGSGPGQPWVDLAHIASTSSAMTCGTIP